MKPLQLVDQLSHTTDPDSSLPSSSCFFNEALSLNPPVADAKDIGYAERKLTLSQDPAKFRATKADPHKYFKPFSVNADKLFVKHNSHNTTKKSKTALESFFYFLYGTSQFLYSRSYFSSQENT